jgi:hypothetical protein
MVDAMAAIVSAPTHRRLGVKGPEFLFGARPGRQNRLLLLVAVHRHGNRPGHRRPMMPILYMYRHDTIEIEMTPLGRPAFLPFFLTSILLYFKRHYFQFLAFPVILLRRRGSIIDSPSCGGH